MNIASVHFHRFKCGRFYSDVLIRHIQFDRSVVSVRVRVENDDALINEQLSMRTVPYLYCNYIAWQWTAEMKMDDDLFGCGAVHSLDIRFAEWMGLNESSQTTISCMRSPYTIDASECSIIIRTKGEITLLTRRDEFIIFTEVNLYVAVPFQSGD